MKQKYILSVISIFFFINVSIGQELQSTLQKFVNHNSTFPQEKIYLHLDKPFYSTGEDIWFKAYLVDATHHSSNTISDVIRVELLNENKNILSSKMLKVGDGAGYGSFSLPDSLSPGNYAIRAYTNWMRNFDENYFFTKSFQLLKTKISTNRVMARNEGITMNFFPEGGDMINGISTMVGFKALDNSGYGVDLEGKIIDQNGNVITTFNSVRNGIGVFLITPDRELKMKAEVEIDGEVFKFDLPQVKENGYTINVINRFETDKIIVGVRSKDLALKNGFLVAHCRGKIFFSAFNESDGDSFAAQVDRSLFPSGVCHLTFFNSDGNPVSERLIWANYPSKFDVDVDQEELEYETRSGVSLTVNSSDFTSDLEGANLSISITPSELVTYPVNGSNICNYLFLSSDIRGMIEEPAYYLMENKESFKLLDYLLMTQGWRRFKWSDVLEDSIRKPKYWAEKGITYTGNVTDFFDHSKPRQAEISLTILQPSFKFIEGNTDEKGFFFINGIDLNEPSEIIFQAKRLVNEKKKKYSDDLFINLNKWSPHVISSEIFLETPTSQTEKYYLKKKEEMEKIDRIFNFDPDAIMLDEVEVTASKDLFEQKITSSNVLYARPSKRIVMDSIMGTESASTAFDLIRRIPGAVVNGSYPNQGVLLRGTGSTSLNSSSQPLYLLDGIPIDGSTVSNLNPQDILFIDALTGADAVIYGARAAGGVLAIYSRKGESISIAKTMGVLNFNSPGYDQAREFYSPDYSTPKDIHAKPDIRSTLYWNPMIQIENGIGSVEFFTSDQIGEFQVIIEGLTREGDPVFSKGKLIVK